MNFPTIFAHPSDKRSVRLAITTSLPRIPTGLCATFDVGKPRLYGVHVKGIPGRCARHCCRGRRWWRWWWWWRRRIDNSIGQIRCDHVWKLQMTQIASTVYELTDLSTTSVLQIGKVTACTREDDFGFGSRRTNDRVQELLNLWRNEYEF